MVVLGSDEIALTGLAKADKSFVARFFILRSSAMALKKYSMEASQATLEYFLIFGVVIVLTLISVSPFFPRIVNSIQGPGGFVEKANGRLGAVGSGGTSTPTTPTPPSSTDCYPQCQNLPAAELNTCMRKCMGM